MAPNPSHLFDAVELKYILDKGWHINDNGLLEITSKQAVKAPFVGRSLRDPAKRTIMIPSRRGCTLLFEGQHFIITN